MQTTYVPNSFNPIPTTPHTGLKALLLCGILFLVFALYKDLPGHHQASTPDLGCKGNPNSPALSPQQLQTLKKTAPGTPKSALTLPAAYCPLPTVVVRAGTVASRDAFRISAADSPNGQPNWGIAMYESNRFAGFRILTEQ
jgi:hypothetical protein